MSLDDSQIRELDKKDFLNKVLALANYISKQISAKSELIYGESLYIYPSVISAYIILKSQWGTHPMSLEKYDGKTVNNLTLLEQKDWSGQAVKFNNINYRVFKDWLSFATGWSDYIIFSGKFNSLFDANNLKGQIRSLSDMEDQPMLFYAKIETII